MGREFDQSNRLLHATRLARRGSYADALSLTTQIVIQCPWSLRRWKRLAGAVFWLARLKVAP